MITCSRRAASRIPRQGQKALVLTLMSGLIGCPVTVSTSVSISLPGPGGGEHFQALWRLSEAAEPQGLSECGWCLHEVRFSLVTLGFFCCCSNLVLILDKYILCMCNYVGRFLFSLRRLCWRIFSQIYSILLDCFHIWTPAVCLCLNVLHVFMCLCTVASLKDFNKLLFRDLKKGTYSSGTTTPQGSADDSVNWFLNSKHLLTSRLFNKAALR